MTLKNKINIIIIIIWMFIIFLFSAQDSKESLKASDQVIIKTVETVKKEKLSEEEKQNFIDKYIVIARKSAHFFLYFILGSLVFFLINDFCKLTPATIIFTIIFCFIYACSDELHQFFINGRTAQIFDVFIDTCGSFLSTIILYTALNIKRLISKH